MWKHIYNHVYKTFLYLLANVWAYLLVKLHIGNTFQYFVGAKILLVKTWGVFSRERLGRFGWRGRNLILHLLLMYSLAFSRFSEQNNIKLAFPSQIKKGFGIIGILWLKLELITNRVKFFRQENIAIIFR